MIVCSSPEETDASCLDVFECLHELTCVAVTGSTGKGRSLCCLFMAEGGEGHHTTLVMSDRK